VLITEVVKCLLPELVLLRRILFSLVCVAHLNTHTRTKSVLVLTLVPSLLHYFAKKVENVAMTIKYDDTLFCR